MTKGNHHNLGIRITVTVILLLLVFLLGGHAQAITNLQQLTQMLDAQERRTRNVDLEVVVCSASRPMVGVLAVQDATGVELLEIGDFGKAILPGEKIRLKAKNCLLRRRDIGIQISPATVVDNDGIHILRTMNGEVMLKAGLVPLRLEWFNHLRGFELEVTCSFGRKPLAGFGPTNFWHAVVDQSGRTNYFPGLEAADYEGYWETVPDFNLLLPAKVGIVSNFNLGFRSQDEMVGIRYSGYFNAPQDGLYEFRTLSNDGSLLFAGNLDFPVERLGQAEVPMPASGKYEETLSALTERLWVRCEGRVGFVSKKGLGLEMELRSERDMILVHVADAMGLDMARLRNALVNVTGVGRGVLTTDKRVVFGQLYLPSAAGIVFDAKTDPAGVARLVVSIQQVQSLHLEEARRAMSVRVRGIVTDARNSFYDRRMSLQDFTRGIFVNLDSITNTSAEFGKYVEVEGHSGAGDFAPVIIADKVTILGDGRLPEPVRPTWTELLNGSKDVQWAELQGLVTDVKSNNVTMLLPEGRLVVQVEGHFESELKMFDKAVVRIRGVLYAMWNAETREVRIGSVMMRNSSINVDVAAPVDSFEAVVKTPRELMLFDAQASAFRRVKVRGQIIYADATQAFLEEGGAGLRLLPSEKTGLRPGDTVEAVGYPDISRTTLLLREVILKKIGEAALPPAKILTISDLTHEGLDSTGVQTQGRLLGWHYEQGRPVLEMQSGEHFFLARLPRDDSQLLLPRPGSYLTLTGVYIGRGRNSGINIESEAFELLLNSSRDIVIHSQPSWWTLQKLLILVGALVVVLVFTGIWITQLRRLVEQRTVQLQREIHERECIENQHALEAERSRIARDLHDDLGSSLTEISVLASTGQHASSGDADHPTLFRAIANKVYGLISALDVIVWAVDPEDNSLQSLADYLGGYVGEYLSASGITCRFKIPVVFPPIMLDGRIRHDLLLAVKETLNNIVRHANATEVEFGIAAAAGVLEIVVADNGSGFDAATVKYGNGLENLSARLAKCAGSCLVESHIGAGTTVKIRLPIPTNEVP